MIVECAVCAQKLHCAGTGKDGSPPRERARSVLLDPGADGDGTGGLYVLMPYALSMSGDAGPYCYSCASGLLDRLNSKKDKENRMTYEIYTDEDTAYGPQKMVRLSDSAPDGNYVFRTFAEAKRALLDDLRGEERELRERLRFLQYNQQDVRGLRKRRLTSI